MSEESVQEFYWWISCFLESGDFFICVLCKSPNDRSKKDKDRFTDDLSAEVQSKMEIVFYWEILMNLFEDR